MLSLLSTLSMFVLLGFLLCGAIIVPHDQKHGAKVVLIALAALVGWRSTVPLGTAGELLNVATTAALLLYRRPVWCWMQRLLTRRDSTEPQYAERRSHARIPRLHK